MFEADFAVMTVGQVRPEGVITANVIATNVGVETTANALVAISLPIDCNRRLSDAGRFKLPFPLRSKRGPYLQISL